MSEKEAQNIPHEPWGLQPKGLLFISMTQSTERENEWGEGGHPRLTKYQLGMTGMNTVGGAGNWAGKGVLYERKAGGKTSGAGRIPPGKTVRPRVGHFSSRSNQTPGST